MHLSHDGYVVSLIIILIAFYQPYVTLSNPKILKSIFRHFCYLDEKYEQYEVLLVRRVTIYVNLVIYLDTLQHSRFSK